MDIKSPLTWLKEFYAADYQTKMFMLTHFIYGLVILATTLYCYGRLDYVRSYRTAEKAAVQESQSQ